MKEVDITSVPESEEEPPEKTPTLASLAVAARNMAKRLPLYSPRELFVALEKRGYRGQVKGRKSLCLMAYRHLKKVRRVLEEGEKNPPYENLNTLLIGPTGSGKTFLIEQLFREVIKVPTVIVDITNYSETGYVGDDVKTVLTRLIYEAKGNIYWAGAGIVCLDEFDKLASAQSNVRFEGQGTSKDVTGFGVQKELLRMLEGGEIMVPLDYGFSQYGSKVKFSCRNLSFVASGAFSGFKALAETRGRDGKMGFRWTPKKKFHEKIAVEYDEEDVEDIENFQVYGFLPELLGRFTRIVIFDPLCEETLKDILKSGTLSRFEREFTSEGLTLSVDESVLDFIVKESIKRQTGARGLGTVLTGFIEDAAYRTFAGGREARVAIAMEHKKVRVTVDPPVEGPIPGCEEEIRS
ncbi:MAG: AAA family ATPase [Candidatus Eremiobacteraeota bacterium]|nr:AAA family ATPase [Candidatus Eremiobacteraeota bacterium]